MINFNNPIIGQIFMLIISIAFSIAAGYGIYKITRPFKL